MISAALEAANTDWNHCLQPWSLKPSQDPIRVSMFYGVVVVDYKGVVVYFVLELVLVHLFKEAFCQILLHFSRQAAIGKCRSHMYERELEIFSLAVFGWTIV
ncbi:hypothetical protein Dimus_014384 [Dionaea muscipula]